MMQNQTLPNWNWEGKRIYDDDVQSSSNFQISDDLHLVALGPYHLLYWLEPSLPTLDYLTHTFPSDDSIMEIMSADELVWEDHHHISSFLPNFNLVEVDFVSFITFVTVENSLVACVHTRY